MEIGNKLRSRRTELGLSRIELAEQIHVTASSISNYENGISYPKPDTLIALILALKIDANYLYQDYLTNNKISEYFGHELSPDEQETLFKYRRLSEPGKQNVRQTIDEEYSKSTSKDWVEYPCAFPGMRRINSGFLFPEEHKRIRFRKKYSLPGMEYCLQIQIDRYEPVFKKYDIVALNHKSAKHNEIGLFRLNNVYYLRIMHNANGIRRLRSLNVNDTDVDIRPEDNFECLGTIIGRIYGTYELISCKEDKEKAPWI